MDYRNTHRRSSWIGDWIGYDHKVWDALQKSYPQISQEREFTLRQEITYLRKNEDTTIEKHLNELKRICDNLAALGSPISEKEKIFALLTSLRPKYESFTTSMLKPPTPSYSELVSLLQGYEQRQSWFNINSTPHVSFFGRKQHFSESPSRKTQNQFNSTGRGFQVHNSSTSMHSRTIREATNQQNSHPNNSNANGAGRRPPPQGQRRMTPAEREKYRDERCQFCDTPSHIAKICWYIPKPHANHDEIPQALAALALDTSVSELEWITDTGASNHMTGNTGKGKQVK